jgi:hypothetical protein
MKVRMRVQIAGLRNNVRWPAPGGVVDVLDSEGAKLCASGFAEPVVEDRVEKAVPAKSVETRTAKKSAAKKV